MVPRVLVVESRPEVARAVSATLAEAGWEAIVHVDGHGVTGAIETWDPHVVLVDLTLPALDGWCVLAEVGGLAAPPFVVVRVGAPDDVDRAVALGADAWGSETLPTPSPPRANWCLRSPPDPGTNSSGRVLTVGQPGGVDSWHVSPKSSFRRPTTNGARS